MTTMIRFSTLLAIVASLFAVVGCKSQQLSGEICSGVAWPDPTGTPINAHGGGILFHDGTYYWYGEHKSEHTSSALVGITCYASKNLVDWRYEGVALSVEDDTLSVIQRGCTMERPKVIYNAQTRKFVMWFHLELKGQGYSAARAAVAVSDTPQGPFKLLGSGRVNAGRLPLDMEPYEQQALWQLNAADYREWWTPQWRKAVAQGLFVKRDYKGGQMSRDMTLFVDDDGRAYHIYSSEENLTLHIAELSADYLFHTGRYIRVAPGDMNEAPTIFKHNNTDWMITSGCTGWAPNAARLFSAPSIWGPWTKHSNPCVGKDAETTFHSQGTFVLPIQGKHDAFMFMADRWAPKRPIDATYVWLPIQFGADNVPYLEWKSVWNLNQFIDEKK